MLTPSVATLNDAEIMKSALADGLSDFLERGDYCFVDRGFRDVKRDLERREYIVCEPVCKAGNVQLTAAQANESRFVTKIRRTVEAMHGILKQKYRLFDHRIDNNLLPKVGTLFKIVSHLNNVDGKRLGSDHALFDDVVERMLKIKDVPNTLGGKAEAKNWNRVQRPWSAVTHDSIEDFPGMTENDLKIFFTGTYQLGQSVSYLADMPDDNNAISENLWYHREDTNILKMTVQSRHSSIKEWRCYLDYVPVSTGCAGIRRHYCECPNGARTVGCCSHVAAVV